MIGFSGGAWRAELVKIEKQVRGIIEAIKAGMFHKSMKSEMDTLEARKTELNTLLADAPEDTPEEWTQASEALRMLIEKSVLTPGPNRGEIDALLYGELGTILNCTERQAIGKVAQTKTAGRDLTGLSLSVVAGAGFGPAAFSL